MTARIYHNPRCSKSRETLALLQDKGLALEVVDYLTTPPDTAALAALVKQLGFSDARALLRRGEPEFKELDLGNPAKSQQEILAAMVKHPRLLERPIVVKDGKAALGRPPEAVLKLFD